MLGKLRMARLRLALRWVRILGLILLDRRRYRVWLVKLDSVTRITTMDIENSQTAAETFRQRAEGLQWVWADEKTQGRR